MEKQIIQVGEFQTAFFVKSPKRPTLLPKERATFRQKLLKEEVKEIDKGIKENDIVQIADGVIDSMYILIGTSHEYGFADRMVMLFDEVHRSNMSKMGPDGKAIFREDGKVMKPETYSEPKLAPILNRDFSVYQENETIKEIARMEKQATEAKIRAKIIKGLNLFDRLMFFISDKIENRLKKKVEVKFPTQATEPIRVFVNGKEYVVR